MGAAVICGLNFYETKLLVAAQCAPDDGSGEQRSAENHLAIPGEVIHVYARQQFEQPRLSRHVLARVWLLVDSKHFNFHRILRAGNCRLTHRESFCMPVPAPTFI
jgi:hypothetical protein